MSELRLPPRRRRGEVNIVPLVDVLTVLIFFFLVSMQFKSLATLNIVAPEIETAGKNEIQRQIELGVSEDGVFFVNGIEVPQEELQPMLETAAQINREIPVILMADEDAPLKFVAFAMDTCRKVGLDTIRLQSR